MSSMEFPRLPIGAFEEVKTGEKDEDGLDICYRRIRFDAFHYDVGNHVYSIGKEYVVPGEILEEYDRELRSRTYVSALRPEVAEYLGI